MGCLSLKSEDFTPEDQLILHQRLNHDMNKNGLIVKQKPKHPKNQYENPGGV